MRIIAGKHRRRRLLGPADAKTTRPITDRVKTSLFDRLAAAGRLEEAIVLDLFSGTGSMGLECLSRGASHVIFVERDRDAHRRLQDNLEALGESSGATVLSRDALGAALVEALGGRRPSLLFVDPPYAMVREQPERVFGQIARLAPVATDDALLVLRTDAITPVEKVQGWGEPATYGYGSMALHLYERAAAPAPD